MSTVQSGAGAVHPLRNDNALKLGVFAFNMKGGAAMTTAEGTLEGVWDEQPHIARTADAAGWEFLLPVSRWRSLGGPSDACGNALEVFTWAAGIAAITEQITVFATAHIPIFHPLLAAKQGATVDQISHGRFGINVVVGWNAEEFDMFGLTQLPHDERYLVAEEWVTVVKQLWCQERADFVGNYYSVVDGFLRPKPVSRPHPILINAGQSSTGVRFAAEHMDFTFQTHPDLGELTRMATEARRIARDEFQRDLGILASGCVVCADTEKEAQRYFEYYVDERGDYVAAQHLVDQLLAGDSHSMSKEFIRQMQRWLIAGWAGVPLVGTPEQIVDKLQQLHDIGIAGVAMTWVNYAEGIDQFNEQVLPLLVDAGLRQG